MELKDMTGPQLVEEHNRMAAVLGVPPVKKFENKVKALMRCLALQKQMPKQEPAAAPPATEKKASGRKPDLRKIKFLVEANPRKPTTDGFGFFAAMVDGMTVTEYLAKYPDDRKRAQLWLYNNVKDGYVELVEPATEGP
jgi:hypothetical protein